jgi:hypothetical protein
LTAEQEHDRVMAELDISARRIVEMAQLLAVLEAEVEIYRPPVIDESEEGSSKL